MALTERNGVSIAQIVIFIPFLIIAVLLCIRLGFRRSAGWLFLVLFSLVRITGASMQLATIANPKNTTLWIVSIILQTVGLSSLLAVLVALLSRVKDNIEKTRATAIPPMAMKLVHTLITVAIALGAAGGAGSANSSSGSGGTYTSSPLSRAGVVLTIVVFSFVVGTTIILGMSISKADAGEERGLLAVALSLPVLLIRLVYSAAATFQPQSEFNQLTGSVGVLVGTAVVPEIIVVLIIEGFGLTLPIASKHMAPAPRQGSYNLVPSPQPYGGHEMQHLNRTGDSSYA
ncbi:hypothetical protein GGR50DRAFT_695616 [Xylaria sp. CBS 124048]|nr:hypothetical protein GGR50DRAFT_695616 [Xylaria sp. CBS 124048]